VIGFDIGSRFLKIAKVTQLKGKVSVNAVMTYFEFKKDEKIRKKPVASGAYEMSDKIKSLIKDLKTKGERLYLSFNGPSVIARDFTVPKLSGSDLDGVVRLEAEHLVFEDLDTMYTDYSILSEPQNDKYDVLFVAAPKKDADKKINAFNELGLDTAGFCVDNVALVNAYTTLEAERAKNETVILLNIGSNSTNIAVVNKGNLKFIRNVAFGGQDVTREIGVTYSVTDTVAEQIKRQNELWQELGLNIKNVLKKSSPNLLEAVFRSMEHCMTRQKISNVDKILITGGGALLKGIDDFIFEVLGIPTEKWNPLKSANIINADSSVIEKGFMFSVAIGLALQKGYANV
jgi:type IV pilus assembly protein PilM